VSLVEIAQKTTKRFKQNFNLHLFVPMATIVEVVVVELIVFISLSHIVLKRPIY